MEKPFAWLLGAVFAAALIAMAVKLIVTSKPPVVPPTIVSFENGEKLEILGVSLGERVIEENPAGNGFFSRFFIRNFGNSVRSFGGDPNLELEISRENGREVRWRAHTQFVEPLFMEIRLLDTKQSPVIQPAYLVNRDCVTTDSRLKPSNVAQLQSPAFRPIRETVENLSAAMRKTGLELLIQQHDPDAGWIDLSGPYFFNEAWKDRYLLMLTNWKRDQPTLDFRAILPNGQQAEFTLPNPDYRKAPEIMSATALPIVHKGPDYTLTLQSVERHRMPGSHPLAAMQIDLKYTGELVVGLENGPINLADQNTASDEWGNVSMFKMESIGKNSFRGAQLPGSSKFMRLKLQVQRGDNYPKYARDGFMLLDGTVNESGDRIDFKVGPDAKLFGLNVMPVWTIKDTTMLGKQGQGWKELACDIAVDCSRDNQDMIEGRIGKHDSWKYAIFSGDSIKSSGLFGYFGGGGTTTAPHRITSKVKFTQLFPPGELSPGKTLRVGVCAPPKPDDLRFEVELPN